MASPNVPEFAIAHRNQLDRTAFDLTRQRFGLRAMLGTRRPVIHVARLPIKVYQSYFPFPVRGEKSERVFDKLGRVYKFVTARVRAQVPDHFVPG